MSTLTIEALRSGLVESVHAVSVAVVDTEGTLVAQAGDPGRFTWWRSAAKPFQALPLVQDGAADHYGFGPRELALACGSNSSEPMHRALAASMLRACGCEEHQLACGPHPPLSLAVADEALRAGVVITPRWSNCSGKHAGMLALARHHGWATQGYERAGHPVQERALTEVLRWTSQSRDAVRLGVDGCTAVCFALSLRAMATSYARFGISTEPAARRLREAMVAHPEMVAGTGRPCTDIMTAARGAVVVKVGADGIYCAALPALGLGVALKVEDGDGRCSPPALLSVLRQVAERRGLSLPLPGLGHHEAPVQRTTRGEPVGELRATGALRFH
ncbi:asparaginase [Pyxidicoccus parkwayensis]|uniref:Asparaginase n=1 Tax=Pyxidicoccus parkwayensis TaxID=2813578 RepID=A0ABX7NP11_9BACT|nr:asparaginase [Pyxidicoccus parkwaysis]QSQ20109.1 asparaginase [Pyxidicoccus parkwaysis]